MTPAFLILLHLAGVACCGTLHDERGQRVEFATLAECQRAGEAWLAAVRHRSANDHFECVRVK
jgi:hypothetical protein